MTTSQRSFDFEAARAPTPERRDLEAMGVTGPVRFSGATYVQSNDDKRLSGQILRIFDALRERGGGQWFTLAELGAMTKDPGSSISAQLRNLRKAQFGGHTVNKRLRGKSGALYEYQLVVKS